MSFGNNIVFLLRFALVAIIFGVCWGVSFAQTSSDVAPQTFARIDETHESKSTQSVTDSDRVLVTNESADTSKTKEKNYSEKRNAEIVFDEYQQRLEDLAKKCDELSMPLEAKVTRSLIYPDNTEIFTIPLLPVQETLRKLPADANKNQRFWFSALNRLRGQYSDEIYSFAEYFGDKKRGYDVVACVLTTLFVNPDHTKARHFFNYTLQDGVWRSRWELQQLEKGLVETPEFGWLPAENVDRYRNGERFYKRQWISSQEEEKRILASASGWRVDTEHFSILSRVSLERGVEIGRLLEAYYQAWSRLFFRMIASETQWSSQLYLNTEIVTKRHKIIIYRNREEYLRELKKHDSNVSLSVGGYFPNLRCTFVYEPSKDDNFDLLPLLFHETTHQLFEECSTSSQGRFKVDFQSRAKVSNFWVVEGVAVYAETFKVNASKSAATLGGGRNVFRIQCALESLFVDKDYVSLREYAGLSREEFQNRRDIATLYSEAAGLAYFFMHYDNGVYRDAFVTYLYNVYQGIDSRDSLEKVTGKTFEELDREYIDFMQSLYHASK